MNQSPRILTISNRVYRHLLYLYPAGHRREYGSQMVQLFHDLSRQTYGQNQTVGILSLWLRLLPDLGMSVGVEHLSELKGNGMRQFCERSNITSSVSLSLLASAAVIALGTLAKATVIEVGGSVWVATSILIAANLAAAAILEIFAHARGTAIIPTGVFVASALLPLLWVEDAGLWLRGNPINAIMIMIAAYWYASGRGRPAWPAYAVGALLAAAQIAVSLVK